MIKRQQTFTFAQKVGDLRAWFGTALGMAHLDAQQKALARLIKQHRGQRILQLSPLTLMVPRDFAPFKNIFRLQVSSEHVEYDMVGNCVTDFDSLPFDDDSMDIVIVHHVLEFSDNPQAILKEAGRITSAGGHIIVMGFNPLSISGLVSVLGSPFWAAKSIFLRKQLLVLRVKDWLHFLDFSELKTTNLCYELPINSARWIRLTGVVCRFFTRLNFPFAGTYCILARKEKLGMRPLDVDWKTRMLQRALTSTQHPQPVRIVARQENNDND